jgi:uncharacterized membrane protein YhaH (DUF805 family)
MARNYNASCPVGNVAANWRRFVKGLETMSRLGRTRFTRRKAVPWLYRRQRERDMLGFIFGFNARLGRLHYFLATIVLAFVMTGLCFLVAYSIFTTVPGGVQPTFAMMKWPVIALGVLFCIVSFALQSMRIRDIGWDPVCVIPTWIAIMVVDFAIARKFPGLSIGREHYGTVVGGLVNLGMTLALLFWPGGENDYSPPTFDMFQKPDRPAPANDSASRIARVSNGEFGRRSV